MKKSIKLSLTLLATTLLFACSNEIKSSKVVVDMPVSDLIDTMGEPDYIEDDSDVMYKEIKPINIALVDMEQEMLGTNIKDLDLDEQRRYEKLKTTLHEVGDVMNAISVGHEIERYDYLDVKVEESDGDIGEADMEAYILNGRVIYKRFVVSE
mgnify:FL=1